MSVPGQRAPIGWRRLVPTAILLAVGAIFVAGLIADVEQIGWDFRFQYFSGAQNVVDGSPLYTTPDDPALEEIKAYVYPPQLAVALTPLTVLPVDVAVVLAVVGSLAALMGALALVGVRDVRCYGAVFAWWPAWTSFANLNLTAVLALAIALAWRFRARLRPLAVVLGLTISAKLFLWPLLAWAVAMRRYRAASLAVGIGVVVTLGAWAVIGFQGLTAYPRLLERLTEIHAHESYSFVGMAAVLGFDPAVGNVLMAVVGGFLVFACLRYGREGDDRRAFTCAIVAALALTPILWQHYLLLLLAPLGLARPRFSVIWLLPVVLWLSPHPGDPGTLQAFLPAVVVAILLVVLLARPPQPTARKAAPEPA
jgi:alpha-1,2-mannosyltransferase